MSTKVRLKLCTSPDVWGRYPLLNTCLMANKVQISRINSAVKWEPMSVKITSGGEYRKMISSTNSRATDAAVASGMANARGYRVAGHTTTRMYRLSFLVAGRGPTMSMLIYWNGCGGVAPGM